MPLLTILEIHILMLHYVRVRVPCVVVWSRGLGCTNIEYLEAHPGVQAFRSQRCSKVLRTMVSRLRTLQRKELADPC